MTNLDYLKAALKNENLNVWGPEDLQAINELPYLGNYAEPGYEQHVFIYDTNNELITLVAPVHMAEPLSDVLRNILQEQEVSYQEPRFKVYEGDIPTILDKEFDDFLELEAADWKNSNP